MSGTNLAALLTYERLGEVLLTLGLSLGCAFLLRLFRRTLLSGKFGWRVSSSVAIVAAIPAAGALLSFYFYDKFYCDSFAIRRLAAILALVLSGLAAGILAEGNRGMTGR